MLEKKKIHLIIIPSYRKSEDSPLRYFDNNISDCVLDLTELTAILEQLDRNVIIDKIDIKAADLSALSDTYFDLLYHLCLTVTMKISVWTWLFNFNKSLVNTCDVLNVSYDYAISEEIKKKIARNIVAIQSNGKVINLKTNSNKIKEEDPKKVIEEINQLGVKSWEILPDTNNYEDIENIIKEYLRLSKKMNFAFQNKLQLDGILLGENYNTDKVYVLPNGKYGIMQFESTNSELHIPVIKEIEDIYHLNYELGKLDGKRSSYCKECNFKLWCLANYYLDLDYTGKSCSGLKNLISEYRGVKNK